MKTICTIVFSILSSLIFSQSMPTIEWQKCLGGSKSDDINSIQQTTDGGYIAAGFTISKDGDVSGKHGTYDAWIVKLAKTGDIEWQKCLGGSDEERANDIRQTTDGGVYCCGFYSFKRW